LKTSKEYSPRGWKSSYKTLSGIGYAAEWQSIPTAAFGAPHLRERIFIVAYPDSHQPDAERRLFAPSGMMGVPDGWTEPDGASLAFL
jgi:DNA (cytosine-5)-methyltransferase 1